MAAGQRVRQAGEANWHDPGRCQKEINGFPRIGRDSIGGSRKRRLPDTPRGGERLGERLGVFADPFGQARQFAVDPPLRGLERLRLVGQFVLKEFTVGRSRLKSALSERLNCRSLASSS